MIQPGSRVKLIVPDNPRLHGAVGVAQILTHYGAHVHTPAAATGWFRALFSEMEELGENGAANGAAKARKQVAVLATPALATPPVANVSGEFCSKCGSADMVRAGACMVCRNCGESGGCS